ncbi:MAG: dienelactone hydrolase family protein [Thermomicrobia bacterium]|nr:dienelactone hydrolase family protein [Thermomicrobia bacterium]
MATISFPPTAPADENPQIQSLIAAWYAGTIGRRDFLMRATATLGTLAAATMLLESCGGSSPTATPATFAPTTAATTTAGSTVASSTSPTAASPAAATAAPVATASGSAIASTQTPLSTAVAGASAPAGTRPAGSAAASATTSSGSAVAGAQRATGVPVDAVNATMVQFPNGSAQIIAYEARPKTGTGPFPAVIVIHENMGLTDHIKDVTRRLAKEGFVGLGVDFLSRSGGTMAFNTPQDVTTAINKLTDEQIISDVSAAITYLTGSGVGAPKVGIVGFCWGGRRSLLAAENDRGLSAAVVYYGPIAPPDSVQTDDTLADAAKDLCPVLGNFGALDPIIPAAKIMQLQQALRSAGKTVDFKIYPDAGHAFNNDTRPFTGNIGYVADAAQDAWSRTLAWYRKYLG